MTILRRFALFALAAVACFCQPSATFKVSGHVVRHLDHRPVRGARVTITMVEKQDRRLSAITGENGEFLFYGLPAAKYSLEVNQHGWVQLYQQLEGYSTAIAAGNGVDSEHIVFELDAPAGITGAVVDDEGEPVRQASVYLFGGGTLEGKPQSGLRGSAITDSDGHFHFKNLTPGVYYVGAFGRPWYAQNPGVVLVDGKQMVSEAKLELDVAFPLSYYGGAATADGASPLKLVEGQKADIQIRLHAVPALHITLDAADTQPIQRMQTSVSQVGPGGALIQLPVYGFAGALTGVPPGDYVLSTFVNGDAGQLPLGSQAVSLASHSTVHVSEGVKTSVSGKVVFEGGHPPDGLGVLLINSHTNDQRYAQLDKDGQFNFAQPQAGHFDLRLGGYPDVYIRKVTAQGGDFADGELKIANGARINLVVEIAKGVSKVSGVVLTHEKTPVAGAMVLLIPQDKSNCNFIPRDQSDGDGTFTLNWAAPGRYTLVAIDNGRGLMYADEAVIKPYLPLGKILDVPVAKDAQVEIELQKRIGAR